MKNNVIIDSEVGAIPEKGTTYWYVRSCMQTHRFKVLETQWVGSMSDLLRLTKGNVYLNEEECRHACWLLNVRLEQISMAVRQEK